MTRLLHTADLHLRPDASRRLEGAQRVVDRAADGDVDLLTIGGDLFDDPGAVEELRPRLRNDLFADQPFEILLIPGNHDVDAFRGDVFFGDACTVATEEPYSQWTSPDGTLRVTALPYRERPDDDLLVALEDRADFDGAEAFLFHGSLDVPFADREAGTEGDHRYFPISSATLAALDFDVYLAGHYHGFHQVPIGEDAELVYPGTPVSTSRSETGTRRVAEFDPQSGFEISPLPTFHYEHQQFTVSPGDEEPTLTDIASWVETHITDSTAGSIVVDGFIDMDEAAFNEALSQRTDGLEVRDETRNVSHLRSHPLYTAFEEELAEKSWENETKTAVRERTLEVFSHLAARGDL